VITAKLTGAREKKYFQVTNPENRQNPNVDFGTPGSPATGTPGAGSMAPSTPAAPAPGGATPPPPAPAKP